MTAKNPRPLTQPEPGDPNYGKFCYQPGSLPVSDLPMQPSLAEQLGLYHKPANPKHDDAMSGSAVMGRVLAVEVALGARFPLLPVDATMADRLMRDEEMLKYINGGEE